MDQSKPSFWNNLRLLHNIKKLNRQIRNLSRFPSKYERSAADLSEELLNEEVERVLKTTPGEVLQKYKSGARIRPLANTDLKSISKMSTNQIAAIEGIGPKSAPVIMRCVDAYASEVRQQAHIRIPSDTKKRTPKRLVKKLYQVDQLEQLSEDAQRLNSSVVSQNSELIKKARIAAHPLLWVVSRSKESAINSIAELHALLQSPLVAEVNNLKQKRSDILKVKHDEYWSAFCSDPARYYSVLDNARENRNVKKKECATPSYLRDLPDELRTQIEAVPLNTTGIKCILRPYQKCGVQYILHQGNVLLGDEMGLGKTIEAIASMVSLRNSGGTHFVVICPASVLINWEREIKEHSDLSCYILHGTSLEWNQEKWEKNGGVAVINFESVGRFNTDQTICMTVIDEAHYIKNAGAARTQNATSVLLRSERRLFLSGTPMENRLDEMVSLISLLQPEIVTRIYSLQQPIPADVYKQVIIPVYFRRTKDAVWREMPKL